MRIRDVQDKMRMRGGLQGIDEDKRRNVQDKMRMRGAVLWSQSNLDRLRLRLWLKKNPYKLSKKSSLKTKLKNNFFKSVPIFSFNLSINC